MKKKTHPARIVVLRTDPLEAQLQKLWSLKPEIKDRVTVTVAEAIAALIREIEERRQSKLSEIALLSSLSPTRELEPVDEPASAESSEPHPDSIWN